nr:MAG TPA: hypothetical protein [Caudoviricetes sp.]
MQGLKTRKKRESLAILILNVGFANCSQLNKA